MIRKNFKYINFFKKAVEKLNINEKDNLTGDIEGSERERERVRERERKERERKKEGERMYKPGNNKGQTRLDSHLRWFSCHLIF